MSVAVFVIVTLSGSPAKAPTAAAAAIIPPKPLVSQANMNAWSKVAWCETHGNWYREGSWHDGGLGITQAAWESGGGLHYAQRPHLATPEEQVKVAQQINKGYAVPDQQGGCSAW